MALGICIQTIIPMRAEASEQSEMVSQLIFGDCYTILEETKKWMHIESINDNYQGWIDIKTHETIDDIQFKELNLSKKIIINEPIIFSHSPTTNTNTPLVAGSTFYLNSNKSFSFNNTQFNLPQQIYKNTLLVDLAKQFMNAPYLWGGKTILGIDCSGLVQVVFKACNKELPRDASEQVKFGSDISFVEEAKPGDLAFFDNDEGKIIHVGIIIENKQIIHASGKVRIDRLDHQGIYNSDTDIYSHKLRIIKRV